MERIEKQAGFGPQRLGNLWGISALDATAMERRQRGGSSNGLRGVLQISPSAKIISEWPRL